MVGRAQVLALLMVAALDLEVLVQELGPMLGQVEVKVEVASSRAHECDDRSLESQQSEVVHLL